MLTGRQDRFPTLRQRHGLSGYPSRAESEHDWVGNSHASTALSYADGLAKALRLQGRPGTVVAFVGDGSLTGGMAWEALNNIAAADDLPLVIVVNDNGRSYTPTVGGLANQLSGLRTNPRYEQILDVVKRSVSRAPLVGHDRVRPPARDQDRAEGRAGAAGDVLRPRAEVRRTDRRPRHRRGGAGPAAGPAVRRAGAGALPDPQGQGLQGRRGPRGGPLPHGRQDRRPDRGGPRRRDRPDADRRLLRGAATTGQHRRAGGGRSPRPCSTRPGCTGSRGLPRPVLRRRHRRAARRHLGGRPGDGRAAPGGRGLRHLPQPGLRPAADGRRAAPLRGDLRARPGRRHRPGRGQPPRHVGHVDRPAGAGPAPGRAARRHPAARGAGHAR